MKLEVWYLSFADEHEVRLVGDDIVTSLGKMSLAAIADYAYSHHCEVLYV